MKRSWLRRQSGQAVILVAIAVLLLTAILMLALDGGGIYLDKRQLQNAADAAALAGAELLMGLPPSYANIHTQAINNLVTNLPGTSTAATVCNPSCPSLQTIGLPGGNGVGTLNLGDGYYAELSVTTAYTYRVSVWHMHTVAIAPVHGFQSTITLAARATAQNGNLPYAVVLLQDQYAQYGNLSVNGTPGGLALSTVGATGGRGGVFSNESINPGTGTISFTPGCSSDDPTTGAGDLWAVNEAPADAGRVATQTVGCTSPMPSPYPLVATHIPYPSYPEPVAPNVSDPGATILTGQTTLLCPGVYGAEIYVQAGATGILLPGVFHVSIGGVVVYGTLRTLKSDGSDFPIPAGWSIVGGCTPPASIPSDTGVIIEITPGNSSGSILCNRHQFLTSGGSSYISLTESPKYFNINVYIEAMPNWQTICTQVPLGTNVVSMTGGGYYNIGGIIYGPADNMKINGGAAGSGVGQIIAWTLTLGGNGAMNEVFNPDYLPYVKGLIQ
jgi:Flp pilus assembly protein TadG